MKSLFKTAAALVIGFGLATSASAQSALHQILDAGVLKVGTTGDWNPMSVRDPATNSYKGFDIDVMSELAKDLGVEVEFVPTDWKTLVNGVVAGKYHITGSASISPSRMKVAGFSNSYLSVQIMPFTSQGNPAGLNGTASINTAGVKVATTLGTTFEGLVRKWYPNADIKVVEAPARGFQEVLSGRADVFITSNIEGAILAKKFGIERVPGVAMPTSTPIATILPQDDQVWINYVNNWIILKTSKGFFETTKAKWGL